MIFLLFFVVRSGSLLSSRITNCTGRPSSPPFLLTVSAHSWYPCFIAGPSPPKSPEKDNEAPIVIGVWSLLVEFCAQALNPPNAITTTATRVKYLLMLAAYSSNTSFLFLFLLRRDKISYCFSAFVLGYSKPH